MRFAVVTESEGQVLNMGFPADGVDSVILCRLGEHGPPAAVAVAEVVGSHESDSCLTIVGDPLGDHRHEHCDPGAEDRDVDSQLWHWTLGGVAKLDNRVFIGRGAGMMWDVWEPSRRDVARVIAELPPTVERFGSGAVVTEDPGRPCCLVCLGEIESNMESAFVVDEGVHEHCARAILDIQERAEGEKNG